MKNFRPTAGKSALAAGGLLCCLVFLAGCHKPAPVAPPKPAAPTAAKTNTPAMTDTNLSLEFTSVFDDRLPRVNTKDPFYPESTRENQVAPKGPAAPTAPVAPDLRLFSVAGPPNKRLVVINNDILEMGERSVIKTAQGKVTVHVEEIGADYVVLTIEGQTGKTRLNLEKKKP
jgi:hypothetical protein